MQTPNSDCLYRFADVVEGIFPIFQTKALELIFVGLSIAGAYFDAAVKRQDGTMVGVLWQPMLRRRFPTLTRCRLTLLCVQRTSFGVGVPAA